MLFCIMRISSCIMRISMILDPDACTYDACIRVPNSSVVFFEHSPNFGGEGKVGCICIYLLNLYLCPGRGGSNQFWKGGEKLRRRHAKRLRSNIALLTSASSSLQCNALAVQSHLHHLHWRSNRSWLVPREWSWSNLVSNTDAKI